MAEEKKAAALPMQPDVWKSDRSTWEYVAIPAENALGERHASIGLNKDNFEPGKTYMVPAKVAEFLRDRLHVYAKSCVRILQPKRDYAAENAVAVGSANASQIGAQPVDASHIVTVG